MAQGVAPVCWMTAGSVVSALAVSTLATDKAAVWMGMFAPVFVVTVSWIAMARVYRSNPARLNSVMIGAFAGKLIFFGVYVALAIGVMRVETVPFVVSLTSYFIALHLIEAILLKRMFVSQQ